MKDKPTAATGYTVSKETALFVEALKALNGATSKYLEALTECYGEEQASSMFEDVAPDIRKVFDIFRQSVGYSVYHNIARTKINNVI